MTDLAKAPDLSDGVPDLKNFDLGTALSSYRTGYLGLARHSPEEIRLLISTLPLEQQTEISEALAQQARFSSALEPLIKLSDLSLTQSEHRRKPANFEPEKIELDRVLILLKDSKIEYDQRSLGLSDREAVLAAYREQGISGERLDKIIDADHAHQSSISSLRDILGEPLAEQNVLRLNDLSRSQLKNILTRNYQLIISAGGDDTAKSVARYIGSSYFAVLNTDPNNSVGALAINGRISFEDFFKSIVNGNFLIEDWPRIQGVIKRTSESGEQKEIWLPSAINELNIMDRFGDMTMRGVITQPGKTDATLKGSGCIITTGSGATGWYSSATPHFFPFGRQYPRTEQRLEIAVRERFRYGEHGLRDLQEADDSISTKAHPHSLFPGETITIHSSSNHDPVVSIDSVKPRYRLPRGSSIDISIAEESLKMIAVT